MSNKNYKPLQLVKNGGLKQALEEGATEIEPLQLPKAAPSEGVQSNVQMIEKITEKAKKMQEYDKVISDFDRIIQDVALSRYAFLKAAETMDDGTQVFKTTVNNTGYFVKSLETICDRFTEIVCRVESIEVETKLNREDADLIRQYQEDAKNRIIELCKETIKTADAYYEKVQNLVKKHSDEIQELLSDHQRTMAQKLGNNEGVWFSFKSFMIWACIAIPSISFTVMYSCVYIYIHVILVFWHWLVSLF